MNNKGGGGATWAELVLLGLLGAVIVLWPASGWDTWAWIWGLVTTVAVGALLGALGVRDQIGRVWIPAVGLAVITWFLLPETTPAAWGMAAGAVVTLFGITAVTGTIKARKPVRRTAVLLGPAVLLACATVYTIGAVQEQRQQEHAWREDHDYSMARLLPRPGAGVSLLVEAIGLQQKIDRTCFLFTPPAKQQFVAAHDANTCPEAIAWLSRQVRDRDQYVNYSWLLTMSSTYSRTGRPRSSTRAISSSVRR
ncbi:hypothetical protein [Haloechinothrix salitolerans]|uniref:Uncharacterized protein n=1 Tax=Haloechinothrix salitolerans TaxID=926830 RepID=A0ABW2C3U6_9PSEU